MADNDLVVSSSDRLLHLVIDSITQHFTLDNVMTTLHSGTISSSSISLPKLKTLISFFPFRFFSSSCRVRPVYLPRYVSLLNKVCKIGLSTILTDTRGASTVGRLVFRFVDIGTTYSECIKHCWTCNGSKQDVFAVEIGCFIQRDEKLWLH